MKHIDIMEKTTETLVVVGFWSAVAVAIIAVPIMLILTVSAVKDVIRLFLL